MVVLRLVLILPIHITDTQWDVTRKKDSKWPFSRPTKNDSIKFCIKKNKVFSN